MFPGVCCRPFPPLWTDESVSVWIREEDVWGESLWCNTFNNQTFLVQLAVLWLWRDLLVKKHWRSWHRSLPSPRWNALGFSWAISFALSLGFIIFPCCSSWLFLACGRSVAGVESCKASLGLCSLWEAAGQVGGPWCPSGAPLMSRALSMGLTGHVHKAVQSHLFVARDTRFERGWASLAEILSKLGESGGFCLFFQASLRCLRV